MIDIVNGEVRIRAWPRKRGKPVSAKQKENQTQFGVIQRIWNALTPYQQQWLHYVTQDSPLLPRDVLTATLYNRLAYIEQLDGKKVYPMQYRAQTSEALDTISQTEGDILIRGPNEWQAMPLPEPDVNIPWSLITDVTFSGNQQNREVLGLPDFDEMLIIGTAFGATANSPRELQFSDTNGASWVSGSTSYELFFTNADVALNNAIGLIASQTTAARAFVVHVLNRNGDMPPFAHALVTSLPVLCSGVAGKINAFRIRNPSALLVNGRLRVYAR